MISNSERIYYDIPSEISSRNTFLKQVVEYNEDIDECIFCRKDPNRILLETDNFSVLAGSGPLVTGYSIIFPKAHVESISNLSEKHFEEFLSVYNLILSVFNNVFGGGHTAYEHGGVGSCIRLEFLKKRNSHCFHAHLVLMPVEVNVYNNISHHFKECIEVNKLDDMLSIDNHYIFYEYGNIERNDTQRFVFINSDTIYSQFMRRNICNYLGKQDEWNWAAHPKWDCVYDTLSLLRPALRKAIQSKPYLSNSIILQG